MKQHQITKLFKYLLFFLTCTLLYCFILTNLELNETLKFMFIDLILFIYEIYINFIEKKFRINSLSKC